MRIGENGEVWEVEPAPVQVPVIPKETPTPEPVTAPEPEKVPVGVPG